MSDKNLTVNIADGIVLNFRKSDDLISLTDIWKASGKNKNHQPYEWIRKEGSAFIDYITNTASQSVLKTVKGKQGGTYAHWQIAVAYAKYLSSELHAAVNQAFKERLEEEQDPNLAISRGVERAVKAYQRMGRDEKWISKRLYIKDGRIYFSSILSERDCDGRGIGMITNTQYQELFGAKAPELKERKGLQKNDNLRDHMSRLELAKIGLAEEMAIDRIEKDNAMGQWSCNKRAKAAAKSVRKAVDDFNRPAELTAEQSLQMETIPIENLVSNQGMSREEFFDKYKSL